ncbi:hypothetical protein UFOVP257_110 [uncultured Caudovirales phage]|uniref:Uncharacterized protein n=1 Tax=uncultured Caudovirales phage TaxID=2100421 RepID=A0A6J5LFD7_9CAUD|nr:hypothetical protein UFOVP257_110 [uncultured Caudovirales phage]
MTNESNQNSSIKFLSIPSLPTDLLYDIITVADKLELDLDGQKWMTEFHENQIQIVSQVYGRSNTILPAFMQQQIEDIYKPFFNQPITGVVGKLTNIHGVGYSQSPPHCDRQRNIAINFIMRAGGDNVLTCYYKNKRKSNLLSESENSKHKDVELDFKVRLPEKHWHAYDVQNYHSVENITGSRLIFSLLLESNPTFEEFTKEYSNLLE